jgi:hypothetical protein
LASSRAQRGRAASSSSLLILMMGSLSRSDPPPRQRPTTSSAPPPRCLAHATFDTPARSRAMVACCCRYRRHGRNDLDTRYLPSKALRWPLRFRCGLSRRAGEYTPAGASAQKRPSALGRVHTIVQVSGDDQEIICREACHADQLGDQHGRARPDPVAVPKKIAVVLVEQELGFRAGSYRA